MDEFVNGTADACCWPSAWRITFFLGTFSQASGPASKPKPVGVVSWGRPDLKIDDLATIHLTGGQITILAI